MTVHTLADASQHIGDDALLSVDWFDDDRVIIHARNPENHLTVLDAHWSYDAVVELCVQLSPILSALAECAGCDATIRKAGAVYRDSLSGDPRPLLFCNEACSNEYAERVSTRPAGS